MLCNLGIYDRIYTGRDHRFNDRDDHDAELYLSPIFYHGICRMYSDYGMEDSPEESSRFNILSGIYSKMEPSGKDKKKARRRGDVICTKTCKRQDQTVQGLTIYFNCRYTCLYHHGNEWNEYSIPTLVYSSSHLCFPYQIFFKIFRPICKRTERFKHACRSDRTYFQWRTDSND